MVSENKILQIYEEVPEIATNDHLLQLHYWGEFDGLKDVLADRYDAFAEWYLHTATWGELIRRFRQNMTEAGSLPIKEV